MEKARSLFRLFPPLVACCVPARGGDGYAMLTQDQPVASPDPMDADVAGAYISAHSPLKLPEVGRIGSVAP